MNDAELAPELLGSKISWSHPAGLFEIVEKRWLDRETKETYVRTAVYMGYPGAVVVLPLTDDGYAVFVRQFRSTAGRFFLELPAGRIDPGEEPEDAAHRELREEARMSATDLSFQCSVFVSPGWNDERQHYFVATGLTPDESAEQDKFENARQVLVPLEDLPVMVRSGEICDAKSIAVLGLAGLV